MSRRRHRGTWAAGLALVLGAGWLGGGLPAAQADTAPPPSLPATVSSDPLPTAQIENGVVYTQVVVGNTVFAGGDFKKARPPKAAPGTQTVDRTYLLAYNLSTGALLPFAPTLNGQVKGLAASPDGKTLYVVGLFTVANNQKRNRVAAFDVATGNMISTFAPDMNYSVYGVAATATTVFLGGDFSSVGSAAGSFTRRGLAAVSASNGAVLPFANQSPAVVPTGTVRQLAASPDATKVVIGGNFETVNGSGNPGYGLAMLNATTGATLPTQVNNVVRNARSNAAIYSLASAADGFYGSAYAYSKADGNLEGAFKADWNGNLLWIEDCHGDTYSVFPAGNEVYVAGHPHYCGNVGGFPQTEPTWSFQRGIAFSQDARNTISPDPYGYYNFAGHKSPELLSWYPDINTGTYTGKTQGPWSVSGNNDYVVYGGEFTMVNETPQQGLVRFARGSQAPHDDGPRLTGSQIVPRATSYAQGIRLSWAANVDRDNELLTYDLIKNGNTASPVLTTSKASTFWRRPNLSYLDTAVTAGQTYTYRIRTTDPMGNSTLGDPISVTAAGGTSLGSYDRAALADGPTSLWRLDETSGTVAADSAGTGNATRGTGVVMGAPPVPTGDQGTAFRFPGNSTGTVSTTGTAAYGPQVFSLEAWIKTTTLTGGKIIGFGSSSTGNSGSYDRHLYLGNSGKIYFGAYPGTARTVESAAGMNNGQAHHIVATLSPAGMFLYVDGKLVGSRTDTTSTSIFKGFWRVGGDTLGSWPGASSNSYFTGVIDSPAVYPVALTAAQVQAHYAAGTGAAPNEPPTAAFSASSVNLDVAFDASASADADGTIASYAWNFGDGTTGSGVTTSHTYGSPGTRPVTLTVTDDDGSVTSVVKQVTVSAANQAPTAAFTSSSTGLTAQVDGSTSTDPDGAIASYAWTFGDGSTGTGATTSHPYATAGTYPVSLKVTDSGGLSHTVTQDVTVQAPPVDAPFVSDAFDRTRASGLGAADVGGVWTVNGDSGWSVANGAGQARLNAGTTKTALLGATQRTSTDLRLDLSADKASTGGGIFLNVQGRRVAANAEYRTAVRLNNVGKVYVTLEATKSSSTVTTLSPSVALPGTLGDGQVIHTRMQTYGTSPTTVRTKVWLGAAAEPADWTVSATDSFAALQAPGSVGTTAYMSSSATNAPVVVSLLDISARPVN